MKLAVTFLGIMILFACVIAGIYIYFSIIAPHISRVSCSKLAYISRPNEDNYEWALEKNWDPIPDSRNNEYGWLYPEQGDREMREARGIAQNDKFKKCMLNNGYLY